MFLHLRSEVLPLPVSHFGTLTSVDGPTKKGHALVGYCLPKKKKGPTHSTGVTLLMGFPMGHQIQNQLALKPPKPKPPEAARSSLCRPRWPGSGVDLAELGHDFPVRCVHSWLESGPQQKIYLLGLVENKGNPKKPNK